MAVTRIQNNQITDSTINAQYKVSAGTVTGNLFATNLTLNSNITILGNLTVSNSYSQLNSINTYINDPLVVFNNGYTGSPTYDIGMLMNRNLQPVTGYNSASVNVAWIWEESSNQFQGILTTETGTTAGVINNSGYANLRIGNVAAQSQTISNSLTVSGPTTLTTATAGGIQAAAIGNVTPGTGAFNTLTATSFQGIIGNATPNTGNFTTITTGGLQSVAIGNVTPGSAVFTTVNTTANIVANSAIGSLTIYGNAISSNTGKIGLGSISNVQVTGGTSGQYVTTDGAGNLSFATISIVGNTIPLGANASGQLVSNAVTLTTSTYVTDAVAQLNAILGKLTPASPPNFPATSLTQTTGTISGLMTAFTQTDNSGWGNLSVAGGTSVNATRSAVFATSTVTNSGTTTTGGNIQLAINGTVWPSNYHALTASPSSADNGTYGCLLYTSPSPRD